MLDLKALSEGTFFLSVLASSLAGSFHCLGMCGGLIAATTHQHKASTWIYHFCRGVGYVLLGGGAGLLGKKLFSSQFVWWFSLAATIAVSLMLVRLGWQMMTRDGFSGGSGVGRFFAKVSHRLFPMVLKWPIHWRAAATGFFTGLLPCGWLYGFVLMASVAQSFWLGASLLLAFWLGTLPALLALSWGANSLWRLALGNKRRWVGVIFILTAIFTVGKKWQMTEASDTRPLNSAICTK